MYFADVQQLIVCHACQSLKEGRCVQLLLLVPSHSRFFSQPA
jgi:hypothetical protein